MPRGVREKSETGIYHIIVRGINRQDIFLEDEDKVQYLNRILGCRKAYGVKVFAYCLMSNHVHLLMQEGREDISATMKRVGVSYVYWYNQKYGRSGHLFQDRYISEPVEDDTYFLAALRYIHQNPVKIGLSIDNWTSYQDYISNSKAEVDVDFAMGLFGDNINEFIAFMATETNTNQFIDESIATKVTDKTAKSIITEVLNSSNTEFVQKLQEYNREARDEALKTMKMRGLSVRQIARLTGINRGLIQKA